ncbi:MAG: hypothetical protein OXG92_09630 [Chloroflexi bacterium]|nr:hypothetical protein [Chloroflexota bacterium]MCY3581301.1 hypothetical protein [Chloroflexota bacterium]MCY3716709.1 hypothetical protein [Chloroflexota bacterium]MDE2649343.1 hypothetical protein [Chloroflexota bacterium]MXV93000.1 hypothetical protein [Chloroflexota bacterium]
MRAADEPELLRILRGEYDHIRKRLRGMAMISRGIVPNLVVSQRAVERMLVAASQYVADETGEAMVGFAVDDDSPEGKPTIYVLDTISPDETAVRRSHTFQQGDALQDEAIWWLQENWHYHRLQHRSTDLLPARFDVPLRYLGDWHKQPGSMIQPSHGDLMTALSWLDDDDESGLDFLLVPIVTTGHTAVVGAADIDVNYFHQPMADGTDMRVDWWYIHRDVRVFQPVRPQIVAPDTLPQMMKYGWHVVLSDRLTSEHYALEDDGLLLRTLFYECDGEVPLEFCFIAIRQGASVFTLLVTQHDYPQSPPRAYQAPFVAGIDLMDPVATFETLWGIAEPIPDPAGWSWSEDNYLLDYIIAIEIEAGLREPARISIPVIDELPPSPPLDAEPAKQTEAEEYE